MNTPASIPRKTIDSDQLSYDQLVAEGINLAQQSSGELWTDFNEHDPGVTILEQCCYALSDLKYQAQQDVSGFLCDHEGVLDSNAQCLFETTEILSVAPISANDWVKVILDRLHQVCFARVLPDDTRSGLLTIEVTPFEELNAAKTNQLILAVRAIVEGSHSLGCDLLEVVVVQAISCELHLSVHLDSTARPEKVIAEIYDRLSRLLTNEISSVPYHKFAGVDGKIEKPLDEIFIGPFLNRGLIEDSLLSSQFEELTLDDVYSTLAAIPGLIESWECQFVCIRDTDTASGTIHIGESVPITGNNPIRLQFPNGTETGSIKAYTARNDNAVGQVSSARLPVSEIETAGRVRKLNAVRSTARNLNSDHTVLTVDRTNYTPHWTGYTSIQNHFPSVFGVGEFGASDNLGDIEKTNMLRFKGYLLLFDQLMANFTEDLSEIKTLFSVNTETRRSYHIPTLTNNKLPNASSLYSFDSDIEPQQQLNDIMASHDNFYDRKSRLLDYLLGLYGESFSDAAYLEFIPFAPVDKQMQGLLDKKVRFLENIVCLSARRGCMESNGVSNLARRVSMRLGLTDARHTDSFSLKLTNEDTDEIRCSTFSFEISKTDTVDNLTEEQIIKLQRVMRRELGPDLSKSIHNGRFRLSNDERITLFSQSEYGNLWRLGELPRGVGPGDVAKWYQHELSIAQAKYKIQSASQLTTPRLEANGLSIYFEDEESEYIRVIENICLRPKSNTKQEIKDVLSNTDFYSHRISIVIPSWTSRFSKEGYRNLLRDTIEAECPAHLAINIIALNKLHLRVFDKLHAQWLDQKKLASKDSRYVQNLNKLSAGLRSLLKDKKDPHT